MEEETDFSKIPIEERCVHKIWKARVSGYEDAAKLFRKIDDEKSPEWNKYVGIIKKFVVDSNAPAQEKGLEAVLAFVENCGYAGRIVGDVMSGITSKCVAAPKAKTKELASQICLMYIEIEKHDAVLDELLKGTESKTPKIVASCISIMQLALKEFGAKVINVNKILKRIVNLIEDRDVAVRNECKGLMVEIFRWLGPALRTQLSGLKPLQISELENEFAKVHGGPPRPQRLLRSQQVKKALAAEDGGGDEVEDEDAVDDGVTETDPYDLLEPVDVLSKLPKDFYTQVEAKKWTERKEVLEAFDKVLAGAPKIESGDYGDLIRALKKIIAKDSNVVVIGLAIKCISSLATGLKKKFHPYSGILFPTLLEKFKEKKQNIVLALREAVDAVYMTTNLEAITEDVMSSLDSKNPSVKAETASFIARCFSKCTPAILNKKLLKIFSTALVKALNESDPSVRENAATALGTAMKVVGEKGMSPYFVDLDNPKMTKIKECCDKAEVIKPPKAPKAAAPANSAPPTSQTKGKSSSAASKPNKPVAVKPKRLGSSAPNKSTSSPISPNNGIMKKDEALLKVAPFISQKIQSGLNANDPATYVNSLKELKKSLSAVEKSEDIGVALLRILNLEMELDELGSTVSQPQLETIKHIVECFPVSNANISYVIRYIACHLPNPSLHNLANDTLLSCVNVSGFHHVSQSILDTESIEHDPKVWSEALNWVSTSVMNTDSLPNQNFFIESGKKALSHSSSLVRNAGLALIGTIHLQGGSEEGSKQADTLLSQQPAPLKRSNTDKMSSGRSSDSLIDGSDSSKDNETVRIHRVDVSSLIDSQVCSELSDRDWKLRTEAIVKLQKIVNDAQHITPNLGDIPESLASRIVDSNTKISAAAIALVESLAVAMGPSCKQHTRVFVPYLLKSIGDPKVWVRSSVVNCINTWANIGGYREFFEGEMIADALKVGSPTMRAELWAWLGEKLPTIPVKSIPKDELHACLPYLFSNIEDRCVEVRKNATEAVPGFLLHLGYNNVIAAAENQKGASSGQMKAVIEKIKGFPPPEVKKAKSPNEKSKQIPAKMAPGSSATIVKSSNKKVSSAKSGRKKDEDVDFGPLLQANNLKHQRVIDEQKLKTLKWNFITPRAEFVELLREQMITANFNKNLVANMFHADFKYHLKAIDSLTEDLPVNREAMMANLDLILRWMTLRFFDTNPSVLLKGLEYLNTVFNVLIEEGYGLLDNEAASFFPYLILKIGDPKDTVRNSVKGLFRSIASVYPLNKQFSYIMEGVKSKNARQRAECLEQLEWLMSTYGLNVCHPTTPGALKEIAKYIADRDTSVRNAAINCVVSAFFVEGDRVLKWLGQISEKDMSLLEERIKRAAKNRPVASVKPMQTSTSPIRQLDSSNSSQRDLSDNEEDNLEEQDVSPPTIPQQINNIPMPTNNISPRLNAGNGPYGLDQTVIDEIENRPSHFQSPKLADIDLQFLNDTSAQSPVKPLQMTNITPTLSTYSQSTTIKWEIRHIGSGDIEKAISAMATIETLLNSDKKKQIVPFADCLVSHISQLLMQLNHSSHPEVVNCYHTSFGLLMKVCQSREMCQVLSEATLHKILEQLVMLLTERKRSADRQEMFLRVANYLVVRLLDNSHKTNIMSALIRMLHSTTSDPSVNPHYQELIVKGLWKLNKTQSEWDAELDYSKILTRIHMFMKDFPTSWWRNRESDLPVRTLKTIIHTMIKLRGVQVRDLLKLNEEVPSDSELALYVNKLIKHMKVNDNSDADSKEHCNITSSPPRLTKETQDELSEIFRMIGDAEESTEGIKRLYIFKNAHPEADIEPFLSKSSSVFQQYIKRGLKALEPSDTDPNKNISSRISLSKVNCDPFDENASVDTPNNDKRKVFSKEAEQLWNRLQRLQEKAGCHVEKKNDLHEEANHYNLPSNPAPAPDPEFELIKQRLDYIKNNRSHET